MRSEREASKAYKTQNSWPSQGKATQGSLCGTVKLASRGLEGPVGEETHARRSKAHELMRELSIALTFCPGYRDNYSS
jgi:hypothetical protein